MRTPEAQINDPQCRKLLREYTALAPTYDQRWSVYLDASLHMTLEMVSTLAAARVLDVACGTGLLLEKLNEREDLKELRGIDMVPAMLDIARQRVGTSATLLECEASRMPFDDGYFQLVTSTSALHYFPDADAALLEIRRVLSADGSLVITDWCRNYLSMRLLNRMLPWTRHAHVHTFSINELERSLTSAGFRICSTSKKKINWLWGLMTVHAKPM